MTDKVESWFIEPLEKHYEVKPKVGVRLTIMSELAKYSEAVLGKAQNWLKTTRKAQTFPSPAECIAAAQQFDTGTAIAGSGVEGGTYGERITALAKARGKSAVYPTIKRKTPEWDAWQRYWRDKKAKAFLDFTRDIGEDQSWTVPTRWPAEFDLGYSAGDRDGRDD